jgi:adenylosuccinate synthase
MTDIKAQIVLGTQFGDEGKGITTDYLVSNAENPIVIRFSGGQQVGHTVQVNGYTHIHSNFGSGTLRNVPTYYSEHTSIYPTTIGREFKVLKQNEFTPKLIFHPLTMITTPWDVIANRRDKENLKHGSCGLGIGKTQKRNETGFKLYATDLLDRDVLIEKMESIRLNYYGIDYDGLSSSEYFEVLDFVEALDEIEWVIEDYYYLVDYKNLIFEGSQGILLDKDFGVFPNVTHANTTSKNAHEILDKLGIGFDEREIFYITRSYSTRHGAGNFKELPISLKNNEVETNVFNEFQKDFKVATLNYDFINRGLRYDQIFSDGIKKNLVITCMDQVTDFKFDYSKVNGKFTIYESWSPDSKDFKLQIYKKRLV